MENKISKCVNISRHGKLKIVALKRTTLNVPFFFTDLQSEDRITTNIMTFSFTDDDGDGDSNHL